MSGKKNRIKAGYGTFCGIAKDGALYCWGNDILTGEELLRPKLIDKGPWKEVGIGIGFLCALNGKDDYVYCYGKGSNGELGDGSPVGKESVENALTPIVGSREFTTLTVGDYHACSLSKDASAFCWGLNDFGQLGTGDNVSSSTPLQVFSDLKNWRDISAGSDHTCATKNNDEGWCWGHNQYSQVSPKSEEVTLIPSKLEGSWNTISAGNDFTLGIDTSGSGFGWGLSELIDVDFAIGGMLGDNSSLCYDFNTTTFCAIDTMYNDFTADGITGQYVKTENVVPIAGNKRWQSVSAGRIPCAIEQGTQNLYCWGYTTGEAYADGSPQINYPVLMNGTAGTEWVSISSSKSGSHCGIQKDGTGWCWGRNVFDCESNCPLGDGTENNSPIPVKVVDVNDWLDSNADVWMNPADSYPPSPTMLPLTPLLDPDNDGDATPSLIPTATTASSGAPSMMMMVKTCIVILALGVAIGGQ